MNPKDCNCMKNRDPHTEQCVICEHSFFCGNNHHIPRDEIRSCRRCSNPIKGSNFCSGCQLMMVLQ